MRALGPGPEGAARPRGCAALWLCLAAASAAGTAGAEGFQKIGKGYCRAEKDADETNQHPWTAMTQCVSKEDCQALCQAGKDGIQCAGVAWTSASEEDNSCKKANKPRCNAYFGEQPVMATTTGYQEYECFSVKSGSENLAASEDSDKDGSDEDDSDQPDCSKDLDAWQDEWSEDKKVFCCTNKLLGCSFDCAAGANNWKDGWSPLKKAWCCKTENVACGEDTPPPAEGAGEGEGEDGAAPELSLGGGKAQTASAQDVNRDESEDVTTTFPEEDEDEAGDDSEELTTSLAEEDEAGDDSEELTTSLAEEDQAADDSEEEAASVDDEDDGSDCDTLCSFQGQDESCNDRIQWVAHNVYSDSADSCAKGLKTVLNDCPVCKGCSLSKASCAAPGKQGEDAAEDTAASSEGDAGDDLPANASIGCDAVCNYGGPQTDCRSRILKAASQKLDEMLVTCALAHSMVLSHCPSCGQCELAETGCEDDSVPATTSLLPVVVDGGESADVVPTTIAESSEPATTSAALPDKPTTSSEPATTAAQTSTLQDTTSTVAPTTQVKKKKEAGAKKPPSSKKSGKGAKDAPAADVSTTTAAESTAAATTAASTAANTSTASTTEEATTSTAAATTAAEAPATTSGTTAATTAATTRADGAHKGHKGGSKEGKHHSKKAAASADKSTTASTTADGGEPDASLSVDGDRDPRWTRTKSTGCTNWDKISMGDPTRQATAETCGLLCRKTRGCVGFGYQPGTCQVTETGGESLQGGCYLWNGSCSMDVNECWDEYTLVDAPDSTTSQDVKDTTTAEHSGKKGAGSKAAKPPKKDGKGSKGAVGGKGGLPPWWELHNVKPAKEKDMGTWTAQVFSKEQQRQFGVDEMGEVVDQAQFDKVIKELEAKGKKPSSSPKPEHEFDCDAGLKNWKNSWSKGEKTWCCENKKLGCSGKGKAEANQKFELVSSNSRGSEDTGVSFVALPAAGAIALIVAVSASVARRRRPTAVRDNMVSRGEDSAQAPGARWAYEPLEPRSQGEQEVASRFGEDASRSLLWPVSDPV